MDNSNSGTQYPFNSLEYGQYFLPNASSSVSSNPNFQSQSFVQQQTDPNNQTYNSYTFPGQQNFTDLQNNFNPLSVTNHHLSPHNSMTFGTSFTDSTASGANTWGSSTFSAQPQYQHSVSTVPSVASNMSIEERQRHAPKRSVDLSGDSSRSNAQTKRRRPNDPLEIPEIRDKAESLRDSLFDRLVHQRRLPEDSDIAALATLMRKDPEDVKQDFFHRWNQAPSHADSAYQTVQSETPKLQSRSNATTHLDEVTPDGSALRRSARSRLSSTVQDRANEPQSGRARVKRRKSVLCHRTHKLELLERDATRIYQCTRKCGKRFKRRDNWKRHQLIAEPQDGWLCMVGLFNVRQGGRFCKLCDAPEVDAEHFKSFHREWMKSGRARHEGCGKLILTGRRDHYTQHFDGRHSGQSLEQFEKISHFTIDYRGNWRCGFCSASSAVFTLWDGWLDHVALHFEDDGMAIKDWVDISERLEASLPPTLGSHGDSSDDDDDGPSRRKNAGNRRPDENGSEYQSESSDSDDDDDQDYRGRNSNRRQHSVAYERAERSPVDVSGKVLSAAIGSQEKSLSSGKHRNSTRVPGTCEWFTNHPRFQNWVENQRSSLLWVSGDPGCGKSVLGKFLGKSGTDRHGQSNVSKSSGVAVSNDQLPNSSYDEVVGRNIAAISRQDSRKGAPLEDTHSCDPSTGNANIDSISQAAMVQSFELIKFLGSGSYSIVEEVLHLPTQLRYARKTTKADQQSLQSHLIMEMRTLQRLRHRHIIRFFDWFSTGQRLSILLSPVADSNLAEYLETVVPFTRESKVHLRRFFGCLVSAVLYIHQSSFTHGDIKPLNILITKEEIPNVLLCDFGASGRSASFPKRQLQNRPLTWKYCAPEVAARQSRDAGADIWSLGCVFLEIAAWLYTNLDSQLQQFKGDFGGDVCYYDELAKISRWLDIFEEQAPATEKHIPSTIRSMLARNASERPNAASLFLQFPPSECCLSWLPNPMSIGSSFHALYALATIRTRYTLKMSGQSASNQDDGYPVAYDDLAFDAVCTEFARLSLAQHRLQAHSEYTDIQLCRSWLSHCTRHHSTCGSSYSKPIPIRLLEIVQGTNADLVCRLKSFETPPTEAVQYAALSYAWGIEQGPVDRCRKDLNAAHSVEVGRLPSPLNEAVTVTNTLGIRYLWIDSFCVPQDNAKEKHEVIGNMSGIYGNALLTIAWPERTSKWWSRGWTYQEVLLSPRVLHFSNDTLFWQCHSLEATSTFPRGLDPFVWEAVYAGDNTVNPHGLGFIRPWAPQHDSAASQRMLIYDLWSIVVTQYTSKTTNPDNATRNYHDLLPIAKVIGHALREMFLGGLWEGSLPWSLLWRMGSPESYFPNRQFPSWTWAEWPGQVVMPRHSLGKPLATIVDTPVSEKELEIDGNITLCGPSLSAQDNSFWIRGRSLFVQIQIPTLSNHRPKRHWLKGLVHYDCAKSMRSQSVDTTILFVWMDEGGNQDAQNERRLHGIVLEVSKDHDFKKFQRLGTCELYHPSLTIDLLDTFCKPQEITMV